MSAGMVWFAMIASGILLALVVVLLLRLLARSRAAKSPEAPANRRFVPTTPDETMVISREQADEMLNK